jgi:hypothetical protein
VRILGLIATVIAGVAVIAKLLLMYRDDVVREQALSRQLLSELQPVTLGNCVLERFGEPNDGGYLMCGNLVGDAGAAYSYGISGYDGWGCDVARRAAVPVHQYDCFDIRRTTCSGGAQIFHEECVAADARNVEGRVFAPLREQISRNGDGTKRLIVKMDVEGAEWESLESTPPDVLARIDQLAIEFHGADERALRVIQRLKQSFFVVHLHFNNYSCGDGPFPSSAYEVLFVSKRVGEPDPTRPPVVPHPLDAPNDPRRPDCQP